MRRVIHPAWPRVGLLLLGYGGTLGLIFALPGAHRFALALLLLPLALTGISFGPLAGAGFGLLTGLVAALFFSAPPSGWSPSWTGGVSLLFYMAVGAGFGLFQPPTSSLEDEKEVDESWEHALDMQLCLDRQGRVLQSNLRARTGLGPVRELASFVFLDDKPQAQEQLEYAYARGEARWSLRVTTVDRKTAPMEAQLVRAGDQLYLELHDLSEMYELERRLSETEARYRVLIEDAIDSLDTGIVILDRHREVIWANQALARVLGLKQEDLVGRELGRVLHEASERFVDADHLERILRADQPKATIALQNGHGQRIFAYNSIPISTENYQGGRVDYYYDITENVRLEEGLREQTERLQASNARLESFTHVVSHDLKEPLRTLEMFSGYLLEDYPQVLDEEGQDHLQRIARAARRMKGLIEDLLELASIGRRDEPREVFNVGEVVGEVVGDLEASLERVELVLPETFPDICANRTRLGQLFANLISNAVKYNESPRPRVELSWRRQGGQCVFVVRDNGMGIEQEYLDRVFELFERLNPKQDNFASTGAGLAICKRIVEEYGGKIWAESKLGEGSTFTFILPTPNTKVVNPHETAKDLVG